MHGNLGFTGKGIGGLHDTFRVENRSRGNIHNQPILEVRDMIDAEVEKKRISLPGKKRQYKKTPPKPNTALRKLHGGSNKVRKLGRGGKKQTSGASVKKKRKQPLKRIKDRF